MDPHEESVPCVPCPVCGESLEHYWEQCPTCLMHLQTAPSADCAGCELSGRLVSLRTGVSATCCVYSPSGDTCVSKQSNNPAGESVPSTCSGAELNHGGSPAVATPSRSLHAATGMCSRKLCAHWHICPDCKLSAADLGEGASPPDPSRSWAALSSVRRRLIAASQRHRRRACATAPPHRLECPVCARAKAPLLYFCSARCAERTLCGGEDAPGHVVETIASKGAATHPLFACAENSSRIADRDRSHLVTEAMKAQYDRDGHLLVPNLLSADKIRLLHPLVNFAVLRSQALSDLVDEEPSADGQPFVRLYNLWRENLILRSFVCQPTLWRSAARLLDSSQVLLYQDSVFHKEPGHSASPWHQDQAACPLSTDRFVTAWIPLTDLTADHGTLRFASGSHLIDHCTIGHRPSPDGERKLYRPRDYRPLTAEELEANNFVVTDALCSMRAGDVTFHSGWTFHSAPPNRADTPRTALAVSFCAADSRLAADLRLEIIDDLPTIARLSAQGVFTPGALLSDADHPTFNSNGPE